MQNITIISTGGTFNKYYDSITGDLLIDNTSSGLVDISDKWLCGLDIINIIGKDSLDMDDGDRLEILETIKQINHSKIIIVHGTDTIDTTAKYLSSHNISKQIILTGAMMPYSIDSVEATANLASAYGYISAKDRDGIYISMNGVIGDYRNVKKDRILGRFDFIEH